MNYFNLLIMIFCLGALSIGSVIYENDLENGIERDIINFTETVVDFEPSMVPLEDTSNVSEEQINVVRLTNIFRALVNFTLITGEEVLKIAIDYSYEHPFNYKKLLELVFTILIIVFVVLLIKPAGYLLAFLIVLFLWFKDRKKYRVRK